MENKKMADTLYDTRYTSEKKPKGEIPYSRRHDLRQFQKSDGTWVDVQEYCKMMYKNNPKVQIYIGTDSQFYSGKANYAIVVAFRGDFEGEIGAKVGAHAIHKKISEKLWNYLQKYEDSLIYALLTDRLTVAEMLKKRICRIWDLEKLAKNYPSLKINITDDIREEYKGVKKKHSRLNDKAIQDRLIRETTLSCTVGFYIEGDMAQDGTKINSIDMDYNSKLIKVKNKKTGKIDIIPMIANAKSALVVEKCQKKCSSYGFKSNSKHEKGKDGKEVLLIATPYADKLCR